MTRSPLRRRDSVTSISPNSSPSHRSPPRKRLQSEFKPSFDITPENWHQSDDLVFDGLVDSIYRCWLQNCRHLLYVPFRRDTWSSNFFDLGFGINIITLLKKTLDQLEERYSSVVVWDVLQVETVANIATMILNVEVMHYSDKSMEYRKTKEEDEDETDTTESSDEREDTPCPIRPPIMSTNFNTGEGGGGDVGAGESMEEEVECGEENGADGGNRGDEGDRMGGSGDDTEKSKEQDGSRNRKSDDDKTADTAILDYIRKTDRRAKDLGITIHFLGNPGITNDPSFLPSFDVLAEPAPEIVFLFHGSSLTALPSDLFSTLDSFLVNGPIIMRAPSAIAKSSYLSTQPAIYYSTSLTYARLWPVLKLGLSRYRHIDPIPEEVSLIAISRVSGAVLNGGTPSIKSARISQNDSHLAAKASSSSYSPLVFEQFANRNMSENATFERKPIHKDDTSTTDADIIISPLPRFEQVDSSECEIGNAISLMTPVEMVTMVAGCTAMGARSLGAGVKEYIIYGFGMGRLGVGADESDWGTAFMKDQTTTTSRA